MTQSIDSQIVAAYQPGITALQVLAARFGVKYQHVRKVLREAGVKTMRAKKRPLSAEARKRMSDAKKGCRPPFLGQPHSHKRRCQNVSAKIRFNVSPEWVGQFDDLNKLIFLNACISKRDDRYNVTTEWYVAYVSKFYSDSAFNRLYVLWIVSDKDKYMRPTIDHIVPIAKGGTNALSNLQFLSWFENRCKNDMSQAEWDNLKSRMHEYLS